MKRIFAGLLLVVAPIASSATVLTPDTPPALLAAEPILLSGSILLTAYNLNSLRTPSLLWSGLGIVVGTFTLAFSAVDSAAIPVADAVIGTMSFFVGVARFTRVEAESSRGVAARFSVSHRSAWIMVRF